MSLKSFLTMFKTDTAAIIGRLGEIKEELIEAQASINRIISMDQTFIGSERNNGNVHYSRLIESAVNGFGVAMWGRDTRGRFLFVNKVGLETMLKRTLEEAVGHKPEELNSKGIGAACTKSEELVMSSETTKRFIECGQIKGEFICLDTIKSPVYRGKEILGTIGSGVIVTKSIPEEVRDAIKEPLSIEIPVDMVLGSRKLVELIEKGRKVPSQGFKYVDNFEARRRG